MPCWKRSKVYGTQYGEQMRRVHSEQETERNRVDCWILGKGKHAATLYQYTSVLEIFPSAWKFQWFIFDHIRRSSLSGFPSACTSLFICGFGVAQAPGWRRTCPANKFLTQPRTTCRQNNFALPLTNVRHPMIRRRSLRGRVHDHPTPHTESWFGWSQTGCICANAREQRCPKVNFQSESIWGHECIRYPTHLEG